MSGSIPILKVSALEVDDRFSYVQDEQKDEIITILEMFGRKDPFDGHCFYLFAHARKHENGADIRMIWQPRLTKPKAQTNSMLFRLNPKEPEEVMVVWIIPPREQWHLYEKGKMFQNQIVTESIYDFNHDREKLESKDENDLTDEKVQELLLRLYPNLFKSYGSD